MKGAGLHTVHTVDDMHSSGQSRLRITLSSFVEALSATTHFPFSSKLFFSSYFHILNTFRTAETMCLR